MASKTIYPYGAGGQLPSSIGIINDLVTGGADKALSAEQGKVIGNLLYEEYYTAKDLSLYSLNNFSLGASGWNNAGQHKAVPVTPGDKVRLSVSSTSTNGGFYGLVTDAYTTPADTSTSIPYISGGSRIWLNISNSPVILNIPAGAAYLIICPKDGSGNTSTWTVEDAATRERLLEKSSIVDNLTEGGSDKVLSAEMGKKLGSEMNKINISEGIDIPASSTSGMIDASGKWSNGGLHKVVAVTPGDTIKLKPVNSQGTGNFYAWLTSSYSTPVTVGAAAPFAVTGQGRQWAADAHGWYEYVVPEGAAWLYIVAKNGSNQTSDWNVVKVSTISADEAFERYVIPEENGYPKYEYSGPLVKVAEKHTVSPVRVATVSGVSSQGGACYGDFLFLFAANNTTCWIYNLAQNALLQTYSIPSEERGFVSNCHCNTVNFGTEKYDAGDPFPLIYVSTGYASDGYTGALVYRIIATTENDATSYSLSLVQTLKMPGSSWTEFCTGDDGMCYLCYTGLRKIYKMNMPALSDGDITFDLDQALSVYQFTPQPSWFNGSSGQNRFYHNGKIYVISGIPSNPPTASSQRSLFMVLDLATETREVIINLQDIGLNGEPEVCFIWNGQFCIIFRGMTDVYALYFE